MKSEKGITLASLGIYLVIILIALITLSTITAYFRSNVNEFNTKTTVDLEFDKFNLYFIEEVKKTNNKIDETNSTETKVLFTSGNTYEFSDNSIILNGNIKIAEKIEACTFSFSTDENNLQSVTVYMKVGETERTNQYTLNNQTEDIVDNEDYIYGYKRVLGTNKLTLDNSIKTNLKDYKIYGNTVRDDTPTLDTPVEVKSVGDKTKNLADLSQSKISTSTTYVTFNYDNMTGTLELTSKPTQYDYVSLYLQRDLGIQFENGKTYYYGGDAIISGKQTNKGTSILFGINYTDGVLGNKRFTANGTYHFSGSFTYTGQSNVRLVMNFNYGSEEPAQVKFENIYVSEINEFEPCAYKIPIKIQGEVLNDTSTNVQGYYINANGEPTYDGVSSYSQLIPVKPNTTYSIKCDVNTITSADQNKRLHAYDKDGNWIGQVFYINYPIGVIAYKEGTGVTPSNCAYVRVSHLSRYENFCELREGTNETINIYLDEPLRKVGSGTNADYIDFENQQVVRYFAKKVIDGTEDWSRIASGDTKYCAGFSLPNGVKNWSTQNSKTETITNLLPLNYTAATRATENLNEAYSLDSSTGKFHVGILSNRLSTADVAGVKAYFADLYSKGNPMYVIYQRADVYTQPIELPNIPNVNGTTILEIDTEIEPSNTTLVYYSK